MFLILLLLSILTLTSAQPIHIFTVDLNDLTVVNLDLNINKNSYANFSCITNQSQILFLDDEDQPLCTFDTDSFNSINADNVVLGFNLAQNEYIYCNYNDVDEENEIVYYFKVKSDIKDCVDNYDENYTDFVFTVGFLKQININTTNTVEEVVSIDIDDDSLNMVFCPEDERDVDISHLIPMAKLKFTVNVITLYTLAPILLEIIESEFGDVNLALVSEITFTDHDDDSTHTTISFELQTTECLWVQTLHNQLPNSESNFIGCSIDYLPALSLNLRTTFADNSIETTSINNADRFVTFTSQNVDDCPVLPISNDVTTIFRSDLIIQDDSGNDNNFNLNQQIIIKIELLNLELVAQSGVSVVINEVIVSLDNEFIRAYDVTNKKSQMQLDYHPFYSDGHFCRYFDSNNNDTCSYFYNPVNNTSLYATSNWNSYLEDNKGVLFDENDKFAHCQDLEDHHIDTFIFTPSNWVFSEFTRQSGMMSVTITAFLHFCSESPSRRRYLQEDTAPLSTIVLRNITVLNFDQSITINAPTLSTTQHADATLSTFALIMIVIGSVNMVLFLIALVFFIFYRRIICLKVKKIEDQVFSELDSLISYS
jgi:hypothetical protein